MITGVHTMFYSDCAEELRAFLRDKLQFPCTDVGDGWLIFEMPAADMGVHPTGFPGSPPANTHQISFYCDDVEATVETLRARGVAFTDEIENQGYGLTIHFTMPGGMIAELYQPLYSKNPKGAAS